MPWLKVPHRKKYQKGDLVGIWFTKSIVTCCSCEIELPMGHGHGRVLQVRPNGRGGDLVFVNSLCTVCTWLTDNDGAEDRGRG